MLLGTPRGVSGGPFGGLGGELEDLGRPWGAPWGHLEVPWGVLGGSWGVLGGPWEVLGALQAFFLNPTGATGGMGGVPDMVFRPDLGGGPVRYAPPLKRGAADLIASRIPPGQRPIGVLDP